MIPYRKIVGHKPSGPIVSFTALIANCRQFVLLSDLQRLSGIFSYAARNAS